MVLVWLLIIPSVGAVLAWLLARWSPLWSRWASLTALLIDLVLVLVIWIQNFQKSASLAGPWLIEYNQPWIPQLGIGFHLALDGLSLLLVALTAFLGIISVLASWSDIQERVGFFHFNLLWILVGITGVFLALDLFLFYFFWEMMLVPMFLIIALWGHERRIYAAIKFFLFTQASGLLMLVAILALYFIHGQTTGTYTFDYNQLLHTPLPPVTAFWLMLGFFIAFAVKLPAVPFHTWLPDAHTEAPTAGSIILAGLMLKTGAYGMIRFVIPLFPQMALMFAPVAMLLATIGILYGAMLAFAQTDLKRLVAYTSVSHMGFVLLGIFAWNQVALQGAVMQILCHGISTGALFAVVGSLSDRIHTREMGRMGGLWAAVPRMGAVALFFALGALGLPGLGNFIGEFLTLLGSYTVNPTLTILSTIGLVIATVYSLWMIQVAFQGPNKHDWKMPDLSGREVIMFAPLVILLLVLGLYPQPIFNTSNQALANMQRITSAQVTAPPAGTLPIHFTTGAAADGERP